MIQLLLFAIQMPFLRNGGNRLDFQKKSEQWEYKRGFVLAKSTTMCYFNVTNLLHTLLVFANEVIFL